MTYDILDCEYAFVCDHCGNGFDVVDMFEDDKDRYLCPECAVQLAATLRPDLSTPASVFRFYRGAGELVRTRCSPVE